MDKKLKAAEAKQNSKRPQAVHSGFQCFACRVKPIIGIRYKCSGRPDVDYCEKCETTIEAPYPLIQIRKPE